MIKMKLNPMALLKTVVVLLVYLLLASLTYAATPASKWVSLDSDLKDRIKRIIQSEVESREGFSVQEDEILNTGKVEEEMIFREIPARHPGGKIAEPPPLYPNFPSKLYLCHAGELDVQGFENIPLRLGHLRKDMAVLPRIFNLGQRLHLL
ncbi:MAG: hypothetical protein WCK00_10640 [Deltaproteobacteria bacterium]